jgi:hypothetical protein
MFPKTQLNRSWQKQSLKKLLYYCTAYFNIYINKEFWEELTICFTFSTASDMITNSADFNPQANYTDWATAAGLRILVTNFADRGVSLVSAAVSHGR